MCPGPDYVVRGARRWGCRAINAEFTVINLIPRSMEFTFYAVHRGRNGPRRNGKDHVIEITPNEGVVAFTIIRKDVLEVPQGPGKAKGEPRRGSRIPLFPSLVQKKGDDTPPLP